MWRLFFFIDPFHHFTHNVDTCALQKKQTPGFSIFSLLFFAVCNYLNSIFCISKCYSSFWPKVHSVSLTSQTFGKILRCQTLSQRLEWGWKFTFKLDSIRWISMILCDWRFFCGFLGVIGLHLLFRILILRISN